MVAQLAHTERRHVACRCAQPLDALLVRRHEHVAAPIEPKHVATFFGHLLEQVDAARHVAEHRRVRTRPPIAVRLRTLVARERERLALVYENDAPNGASRRQVISESGTGDAGATDDDVGDVRHGCAHQPS